MPLDIFYSHWILVWYILYKFKVIPYNPVYTFIAATIYMIIIIFVILIRSDNTYEHYKNILLSAIISFIFKVLPAIDAYKNPYSIRDHVFGLVVFIIYNIYIYLRGYPFASIYLNMDNIEEVRRGRLLILHSIKKTFGI